MKKLEEGWKSINYEDGNFMIIITEDPDQYSAIIWRKGYGYIEEMFAISKDNIENFEEFEQIVEANLTEYELLYKEELFEREYE